MTNKGSPPTGAITVREAATCLAVSERTVQRWIADGALKAFRFGPKLIRIQRAEFARFRLAHLRNRA